MLSVPILILLLLYWYKDKDINNIFAHPTHHFLAAKITGPSPQPIPAPAIIRTFWKSDPRGDAAHWLQGYSLFLWLLSLPPLTNSKKLPI